MNTGWDHVPDTSRGGGRGTPPLRRAEPIVRDFCASHRVSYTETNLLSAYGTVVRYLNHVGLGASDPFRCPLVVQYRA